MFTIWEKRVVLWQDDIEGKNVGSEDRLHILKIKISTYWLCDLENASVSSCGKWQYCLSLTGVMKIQSDNQCNCLLSSVFRI